MGIICVKNRYYVGSLLSRYDLERQSDVVASHNHRAFSSQGPYNLGLGRLGELLRLYLVGGLVHRKALVVRIERGPARHGSGLEEPRALTKPRRGFP